ncbi:hypothetical protein R3P38DRAFT_3496289 [Favolaschia claudopus]|uniref:Uncharacterized protein n=1 Tax=Favolaschia claudopus TaxID=2862362 RepID=A0AAW0C5P8_9AGAR
MEGEQPTYFTRRRLDSLSGRDVIRFRDYMHSPAEIRKNPEKFQGRAWIDVFEVRQWLAQQNTTDSGAVSVRIEPTSARGSLPAIKIESGDTSGLSLNTTDTVRLRTYQENGHDVLEILLDNDSDIEEVSDALLQPSGRSSSPLVAEGIDMSSGDKTTRDFDADNWESKLRKSDTLWQDPGITSLKTTVERIEYIMPPGIIPSIWPNPRIPTAFVLDFGSKFDSDINPKTGKLYTLDCLIKNHARFFFDNDSWKSDGSGQADGDPMVLLEPGQPKLPCRRARMGCRGAHACERIDRKLIEVDRYDLDPATRDAVLNAQQNTCRNEGTTVEDITATQRCTAVDSEGNGSVNGQDYWVACNGWRKTFKENHRTFSLPERVSQTFLMKLFRGERIAEGTSKDTQPCSRIIAARTGNKLKACHHPHIVNGHVVTNSEMSHYKCRVKRNIFVPRDESIRKAVILHNAIPIPHRHPLPPLVKVSLSVQDKYETCIEKRGVVGATVHDVDRAESSLLLCDGQPPSAWSPALGNMRSKRDMVREQKVKKYPAGMGIPGAFQLFLEDQKKPLDQRYIHCCRAVNDGGVIIITGVPFLIKLLDDPGVRAFDDDTTFKRVEGEMNEWELALFFKAVERASADFYEILFDELQRVKELITGKVLGMKRFVPGGNLLVMNADMEAAQVIGIARSVMKTNIPEYSGIPNDITPAEAAKYFVKICYRHTKEAIHDFKSLVTPEQYNRLMNFMYIDSKERLEEFSRFVNDLGIKKIQDWWAHKEIHDWIIPCLVKALSNIYPDDWDTTPATTNTGETQHHWTNAMTGTKLSLVEAIERLREQVFVGEREYKRLLKQGIQQTYL